MFLARHAVHHRPAISPPGPHTRDVLPSPSSPLREAEQALCFLSHGLDKAARARSLQGKRAPHESDNIPGQAALDEPGDSDWLRPRRPCPSHPVTTGALHNCSSTFPREPGQAARSRFLAPQLQHMFNRMSWKDSRTSRLPATYRAAGGSDQPGVLRPWRSRKTKHLRSPG
jgi:hypothetical protein